MPYPQESENMRLQTYEKMRPGSLRPANEFMNVQKLPRAKEFEKMSYGRTKEYDNGLCAQQMSLQTSKKPCGKELKNKWV